MYASSGTGRYCSERPVTAAYNLPYHAYPAAATVATASLIQTFYAGVASFTHHATVPTGSTTSISTTAITTPTLPPRPSLLPLP